MFRPLSWCSTSLLPDEASVPASCSSLLCSCFNTSCITRRRHLVKAAFFTEGKDPGRVPQREVDSTKRVLWQDANIFIWSESELKSAQSERPRSWIQMLTVQTSAVWQLQRGSGCQIRSIRASDVIVTRRRGSPPEQRTWRSFLQPKTFNIRKMWKTIIKRLTPKYWIMKLFSYISHLSPNMMMKWNSHVFLFEGF